MGNEDSIEKEVLRVAMIGFGNRAEEHLDALEQAGTAIKICVLCDTDAAARKRAGRRLPGVNSGHDLATLLKEAPCDIVVVCLPPSVDLKSIGAAIAGVSGVKAVLVEKPAANSAAEAEKALGDLPVPVFLFHQMRFLPWAAKAAQWYWKQKAKRSSPAGVDAFCYGKLLDQGLHVLDLACWIVGGLPRLIRHAVAEYDPARISAREPLPFDWRMDHAHEGPTLFEVEAEWDDGLVFSLKTGPSAADGWLGKGLRISFGGDDWLELGTMGLSAGSAGEDVVETGTLDDYKRATASVYESFFHWLIEGGTEPDLPTLEEHLEQLRWYEDVLGHDSLERLPPPHWLNHRRPETPILVVIPLSDHRGIAEDCVRGWTQDQENCAAGDYQLVVVSNEDTKELGNSLRPLLRSHDQLIETNLPLAELGQGDMEEYVIGIGASDSEWIFLTEPHCEVPSDFVAELKQFFKTSEAAGFCTGCVDIVDSSWGMMEALYSAEGFAKWQQEGDWGKMIMRGFGVRRTAYEIAGGFRLDYGRFSEWLLAADLHRRGCYLEYAPKVRVFHHYTLEKSYLDEAIEEFVIGQARYASEAPEDERLPYFPDPIADSPPPPELNAVFETAIRLATKRKISVRRKKNRWISPLRSKALARDWNAFVVRMYAGWLPSKAFPYFKAYYEAQIQAALTKHLPEFSKCGTTKLKPGERWTAAGGELRAVIELHQREEWNEEEFHWSKPIFAIPVDLSEGFSGVLVLKLVLPDILGKAAVEKVFLITSGNPDKPLIPRIEKIGEKVELAFLFSDLPGANSLISPDDSWFVLVSPLIKGAPEERRELGIPIEAVSLSAQGGLTPS